MPDSNRDVAPKGSPGVPGEGAGPIPVIRTAIAGVLMGLANLVPGVSGGTMVLVMGLYDDFVSAVADVTRLRITRRSVLFLGLLVLITGLTILFLAGAMKDLVVRHREAMYALFIGMTLGGAPLLYRMVKPLRAASTTGLVFGLLLMVIIAATRQPKPEREATGTEKAPEASYVLDVAAGALGMSAMVLPGVSGAYMLLILDRYTPILGAIDEAKHWVTSSGSQGDLIAALAIIIPVGIGAAGSLVGLSNLLKWLLHHRPRPTLGFLLGILLGSVVGIWPFEAGTTAVNYALGGGMAVAGFFLTLVLSYYSR